MATMLRGLARGQWTAASSKLGEMVTPGRTSKRLAELTIPTTSAISRLCHRQTSDPDREIYNGILSTQIKLVKGFSLTTSCIGLACQPVLLSYSSHANAAIILGAGAFLSFFTFATPLLIHTVSKKYVTKLYYNQVEDKYTAVVYNLLLRPKKIEFKLDDVDVPDVPGMFTTFKARNVPLFVEGSAFHDPWHYGKLMGYDKPIEFRWDSEMNCTKSEADARRKQMAEQKKN